ncbi:complex I 24 kDa subunit family protein [Cerasicoccus arenae]|uniref:NADH-quinone oxidoreductase subunit E n=1 Tax=Cerasicoccus arenae TaxID=424488 RepID=A0A8J3DKM4_9BACT|nr:NAD(P)H-dependent oxidoreductase subunit E [Cerasicoccus arenae]MBK1856626.1 NAD(P)H-dependent oxidoreductase subunit E [Cerasicoccus arenae]GHC12373.1 NADH-quinone oxidoreductase subunit E [Cerasicoccus arenae]
MDLSLELTEKIDKLIPRYPDKRSATLPLCHLIQEEKGYLSKESVEWIAAKLDLQPMQVWEVVTFYPMYRREPIGKVHVKVCRTLSCALRGSYKTCEKLEQALGCKRGETSHDGKFTIEFVECIADCGYAPVVQVDDKLYEKVTPDGKTDELIEKIKRMAEGESVDETPEGVKHPAFMG